MCEIEVSYVSFLALDRQTTNTLVSLIIYKSSFFHSMFMLRLFLLFLSRFVTQQIVKI